MLHYCLISDWIKLIVYTYLTQPKLWLVFSMEIQKNIASPSSLVVYYQPFVRMINFLHFMNAQRNNISSGSLQTSLLTLHHRERIYNHTLLRVWDWHTEYGFFQKLRLIDIKLYSLTGIFANARLDCNRGLIC